MDVVLSDPLRRWLCRVGFVLLCLLPTVLCVKWSVFPRSAAEWSASFQYRYGLINRIESVQVRSPNRVDWVGVEVGTDRFSSRLEIDQITRYSKGTQRTLRFGQVQGSPAAFWNSLQRMVETVEWSGNSSETIQFQIESLTLFEDEGAGAATCEWSDVQVTIDTQRQQLTASFRCRAEESRDSRGSDDGVPRATIQRTMDHGGALWYVDARGCRVPGWVIRQLVPVTEALNVRAELSDILLSVRETDGRWNGEFRGRLLAVDLNEVVARPLGAMLTGTARIDITSAKIVDNRIQQLTGDIECQGGLISQRLLQAACMSLQMEQVESIDGSPSLKPFGRMQFQFHIDRDQLAIFCPDSSAILNDDQGRPLLIAPHGHYQPVASLIRLLSWPGDQINSRAASLASHLMMPSPNFYDDLAAQRTAHQDEVGVHSYFK